MHRAETIEMLRAERRELSDHLGSLEPEGWGRPSLCAGWTVLDVTAHVVSVVGLTRFELMGRIARYGTGTDGANARSAAAYASRGPDALSRAIAEPDRLGLGFFLPQWALCETIVHHQDIRRALGHRRQIRRVAFG